MNDTTNTTEETTEEPRKELLPMEDTPATESDAWERFVRKAVVYYLN